jgi:putative transposase
VKYRHNVLEGEKIKQRTGEIIRGICERYGFELIQLGTDGNHIHVFVSAPPRFSPSQIVTVLKSISARQLFKEFPEVKKMLWGGEFWGDGFYVGTVGDGTTTEIIKRYILNQGKETEHKDFRQLTLF